MHVHFLDPYRPRSSPIHTLDARIKLILAGAFILTAALAPNGAWPLYVLLFALVYSAELISDLGPFYVLRRAVLALPFVLAALPLIFTVPGPRLYLIHLGTVSISLSEAGVVRFLSVSLKSWLSVQAAILLSACTSFPDLLVAMRALRVPRLLVAIIGLMWRYLFVLADEALRLLRARDSRSGDSGDPRLKRGGTLTWRAHVTGGMAGSLFLRAFERSDRIYAAMVARGYDGEPRSLSVPQAPPVQWALLAAALLLLAALLALAFLIWA